MKAELEEWVNDLGCHLPPPHTPTTVLTGNGDLPDEDEMDRGQAETICFIVGALRGAALACGVTVEKMLSDRDVSLLENEREPWGLCDESD